MRKLMQKLRPIDVITLVLVIGLFILKCKGIDHVVDYSLIAVVGWYYGRTGRKEDVKP